MPAHLAMRSLLFVSFFMSGLAISQTARVGFDESVAIYGPEIFPALAKLQLCGDFRVLVAYINGTELLFVDEVAPAERGSTLRVVRSFGFSEFNHYEASRSISEVSCQRRDATTLEISGSGNDGHSDRDFEFTISLDAETGEYENSESLGLRSP